MAKHPTPWTLETAPYEGWNKVKNFDGREVFLGRILDAKGKDVYGGPASFNALTKDAAEQIIEAVNHPLRDATTADGSAGMRRGVRR